MKFTPLVAGAAGTLVAAGGTLVVGDVSGAEAHVLLESILPSARFLCSSVMTSAATILALLLTGLGLARGVDIELKPVAYTQMRKIALVDSIALTGSVLVLLMLLNVPLQETEQMSSAWHKSLYYTVIGTNALLGGMLISIVVMLYETIKGLTLLVGGGNSPFRKEEDEEQAEEEQQAEEAKQAEEEQQAK